MIDCGKYLENMRANAPLVQNITNFVAMNVMANVMLASGASPAMVHTEEEAGEFVAFTGALTVNIGTLSPAMVAGAKVAVAGAQAHHIPWVLDPVAGHVTSYRRQVIADLLTFKPKVIRGNASEILGISGAASNAKGADAGDEVEAAVDAAKSLAAQTGGIIAVTGAKDLVTDGERAFQIENGDPIMPLVTALGCSLTGVVGAFIVDQDPLEATVAALAYYGAAGEIAAKTAQGPASFAVAFVDALHSLDATALNQMAKVKSYDL